MKRTRLLNSELSHEISRIGHMDEEIVVASEIHARSRGVFSEMMEVLHSHAMEPAVTEVPHDELKRLTRSREAIVGTGDDTPYANVIPKSGVVI